MCFLYNILLFLLLFGVHFVVVGSNVDAHKQIAAQNKFSTSHIKFKSAKIYLCKYLWYNLPFAFVSSLRCFWQFGRGWWQTLFGTFQIFFKQLNAAIESSYFRFSLNQIKHGFFVERKLLPVNSGKFGLNLRLSILGYTLDENMQF